MPKYKWADYSREELQEIIDNSTCYTEVMRALNYSDDYARDKGKKTLYKMAEVKGVDISNLSKNTSALENRIKVGDIFGKWTVKKLLPSTKKCLCECECGEIKEVYKTDLRSGTSTSCGNCTRIHLNQKFGFLTVLEKDEELSKKWGVTYFKCLCKCGNQKSVRARHLKNGSTLSCGCLKSKGNQLINKLLTESNYNFLPEYSFEELQDKRSLYFDFVVFNDDNSIKCLIEYNGEQHYYKSEFFGGEERFVKQKQHDQMKRDFCRINNLKLIEIPYWDFKNITIDYLNRLINDD